MALGGGSWLFQNKKLPGTYINFISKTRAQADVADRGYATMPITLSWGAENEVFAVTAEDFMERSLPILGYDYTADELKGLRDLFLHAKTVYLYRVSNTAVKATGSLATAKYAGTRGNDITVAITANVDTENTFDVSTYISVGGVNTLVDKQTACAGWTAVKDNDYVAFKRTATFEANAGVTLSGGTDGEAVTGTQYQAYIDAIEPYYFNVMGYAGTDSTIQALLIAFNKRMRDNVGAKFQLCLYNATGVDYEGVISVKNTVTDSGAAAGSLVYWLTGAEAGCEVNASCTNMVYDGEYAVNTKYSQSQLEQAITAGMLILHNVADSASGNVVGTTRILRDINTFTSFTKSKNSDFAMNQVIRVLDQIAIDVSRLFGNTYLGKVQNDEEGRISLWGDIVELHKDYERVRAIQNFKADDVPIPQQGTEKNEVVFSYEVQPTVCMEKLYVSVVVA